MVSTRSYKYKFCIGEKVLCYEPDLTKAKVLYDSKVMEIIEAKDRRGKKIVEYLIHFNGWNSSWDRRVNENFVLKDTDVNRQLQKDLADKSQLQIGAYLYRKDRKKRSRLMSGSSSTEPKQKFRGSSEDGSTCSTATIGGREEDNMASDTGIGDLDTESYSSSAESNLEEDRVFLQIGEKLKAHLDHDFCQITRNQKLIDLPAKISVLTILESFVKYISIQTILAPLQPEAPRRRNSAAKSAEKKEKDYGKINNSINVRKEVADGLRVYFDFILKDYLLYKEEKEQANKFLSDEHLNHFIYKPNEQQILDLLCVKRETPTIVEVLETPGLNPPNESNDNSRRRLRSYKTEDSDNILLEVTLNSGKQEASVSSIGNICKTTPSTHATTLNILKNLLPVNISVPTKVKDAVQDILKWRMLSSYLPAEPSMIYGAVHLARLIVKLPDFLNASSMTDDKLKLLLSHLDVFIEFLEDHPEWFGDDQYKTKDSSSTKTDCTDVKLNNNVKEIALDSIMSSTKEQTEKLIKLENDDEDDDGDAADRKEKTDTTKEKILKI